MSFAYYNVHGLVEISVDARCNFVTKFDHQLRQFNVSDSKSARSEVIILPYSDYRSDGNHDVCFDYMRCSATEVHDPHRRIAYAFDEQNHVYVYYMDDLILPVNYLVQIALMSINHSFIHAASVNIAGSAMVFSAFAGVGKTSIVLAALKRGFEINGDDLVIVGDGFVFPYPQDLSVYAYHTQIIKMLPNVYGRRLRRAGKVHSFLEKLPRRNLFMRVLRVLLSRLYPQSTNVPSRLAYGEKLATEKVKPQALFFMSRSETLDDYQITSIGNEKLKSLTMRNAHILLAEWHAYFYDLILLGSLNNKYSLNKTVEKISKIYSDTFSCVDQREIKLSILASESDIEQLLNEVVNGKKY